MKIKEVIIVEGRDDTAKIRQAVDADTIETNGSAVNENVINQIKHAKEKRGVIIFTDPDYPGERIRHIINQAIPGCKHAFLTQDEARANNPYNKSLGIEHATPDVIRNALANVYELMEGYGSHITKADLINNELIGSKRASDRREKLGKLLRIGHTNGKQLLKRLGVFQITKQEFEQALEKLNQEEQNE